MGTLGHSIIVPRILVTVRRKYLIHPFIRLKTHCNEWSEVFADTSNNGINDHEVR
jgi:hypothetical protein